MVASGSPTLTCSSPQTIEFPSGRTITKTSSHLTQKQTQQTPFILKCPIPGFLKYN